MRSGYNFTLRLILLTIAAVCLPFVAVDQARSFPQSESITRTVSWSDVLSSDEIRVPICNLPTLDPAQLRIDIVSLPSGLALDPSAIKSTRRSYENGYYLLIKLRSNVRPDKHDEELRITVRLPTPRGDAEVAQVEQPVCAFPAIMSEVLAREKTSTERRLLMSPSLSFPAGGSSEVAANGVLYRRNALDRGGLIDQIDLSLMMDKGSDDQADPNFFNIGINFKKIIPFHYKKTDQAVESFRAASLQLQALRDPNRAAAAADAQIATADRFVSSAIEDAAELKNAFFRTIEITPLSPRVEMNFSGLRPGPVINFINNSKLELASASKPFISKHLFWSLKLVPLGLESGVILRNRDNVDLRGRGIVRLHTGGNVKIKFRFPCRDDLLADRIELEMKAMNRYLFNEESFFNRITKRNDLLVKGSRYWTQVDLRYVFGFRVPFPTRIFGFKLPNITRKPAVTVSYKNGYAPPVYQFTNSVGFRFTLASGDEDTSSDVRISEAELLRP